MTHDKIYSRLISKMKSYHPNPNIEIVKKAYELALDAHGEQLRKSGEPYIIHPMQVAYILAELELDSESIVSGILHDVIEDTPYSFEDISTMFSPEIAEIVDGVTKLDKLQYSSKEELQAENYRKMFFAMAKDIRVILIKIADRLHNMRTLKYMSPEKQKEKAQETMDIYAPIAHKLGVFKIRYELEDLSFRYLDPDEYYHLADEINLKQSERQSYITSITKELKCALDAENIKCEVEGRPKHFYSIYRKMYTKNKLLDEIHDLFAVRVLVENTADCYNVLGVVNTAYKSVAGRFKDYISVPKENGYQSLHNTLIGPDGTFFEIQIRTYEMHRVSEYGVAAHWKYKETGGSNRSSYSKEEEKLAWLREVLEIQRDVSDNGEFLQAIKGDFNFYEDRVYCYTPKGSVINLSIGATPIDFAYAIHTEVGNKMVSAKVNGRIVPYEYTLQTTDKVEIITSKSSTGPSLDWLKIAKTTQAKNKINQWFKSMNKEENIIRGKEIIEKELNKRGYNPDLVIDDFAKKYTIEKFKFKNYNSLCAAVGHGGIKDGFVVNRLIEAYEKNHAKEILEEKKKTSLEEIKKEINAQAKHKHSNRNGVNINGLGFTEARFSKCCGPVPGDDIVVFTTRGRGATVHRSDCVNIVNVRNEDKGRILKATWPDVNRSVYIAILQIDADNYDGLILNISRVFLDEKISMENLNVRTSGDVATIVVEVKIQSINELDYLKKKLLSLPEIHSIRRITT